MQIFWTAALIFGIIIALFAVQNSSPTTIRFLWMYAENVHGRPTRYPGHARDLADGADAVLAYHDRCHQESLDLFRALAPEQWIGKSVTPAGTSITTWKWVRAMVEHEAHHRGQLYLMLGLIGVAAPPIFGLTEPEVLARSMAE